MIIFRAVKTDFLRQKFGAKNTPPAMLPTYQKLGMLGHDGFDWAVRCQDNTVIHGGKCDQVYCDIDGSAIITSIYKDDTLGWGINAFDEDKIHKHCWWHFDIINPDLKVGDKIEGGDLLGVAGNTGMSTGAHLHRGLYSFNEPEDNGYRGAIDPEPFYQDIYILDKIANMQQQVGLLQQIINLLKLLLNIK